MRKIYKLLYRYVVPPFLIALLVLTFVVFAQEIGNRSELLISRDAPTNIILTVAGCILPRILIFSLPLSFLIGVLIGLSGLSGENQITALRACGVPARVMLWPLLIMGAFIGFVTGTLSLVALPQTNEIVRRAIDKISLAQASSQIQPRVFNEDFPNTVFYFEDLSTDRLHWSRVFLADSSDVNNPHTVLARSGTWIADTAAARRIQLHLEDGKSYSIDKEDPSKDNVSLFASTDIPINLNHSLVTSSELDRKPKKVVELSTPDLWSNRRNTKGGERNEELVELNYRMALPFSVLPFALLGLALAVNAKKGGRTSGFALCLMVVLLFYMLFINGIRLALVGKVSPWIGAWAADFILATAGILLLVRAERVSGFGIGQWLSSFLTQLKWKKASGQIFHQEFVPRRWVTQIDNLFLRSMRNLARFIFPKVFDLYIAKGFFIFLTWSLVCCSTLFVLLTLFDLLDDIIRNRIPILKVVYYFVFLTPQILMVAIPMSILLAILINFGILEKNSEITAIKAGGWSLYRIAIPVFLIASGFCICMFFLQDYVLPYANTRQDNLHNAIKGRPAQTSKKLQRKWIFGESDRIYNYEYFDGNQDSFVDLNIYDVDLNSASILRRFHAARARIDSQGSWILEDGWVRDYRAQQSGFKRIHREIFLFPEKAGYFEREIFQPKESSKWTYQELRSYINYLMKSGYNATELRVALDKKISFPASCLVMALLGVPFSFSTGKKGAFFGIGISIAIAITYWGLSGVFEAMGAYGVLTPLLAAWAPNILFGAAGFVMLLTIRT